MEQLLASFLNCDLEKDTEHEGKFKYKFSAGNFVGTTLIMLIAGLITWLC